MTLPPPARLPRRLLLAPALALAAAACGADQGEIVVALQSDLSIPKDIDTISLEILTGDRIQFAADFPARGAELELPGTLGVSIEDPADLVTFRATAFRDGVPRILRQAVTRAPEGRVALLRLPLQWLCDGSAEGGEAACPGREGGPTSLATCQRGACVPAFVEPESLADYTAGAVFGGGSGSGADGQCFDVAGCFEDAVAASALLADCSIEAPEGLAVALRTEGDGVCGPRGCHVPLEAAAITPAGEGRVALPAAACQRVAAGKALGFAVSRSCGAWAEEQPLCGPWSLAAGPRPDPTEPVTLAVAQRHPRAIVLHGDHLYWTNAGVSAADGEVKRIPRGGGTPERIAAVQASPAGLAIHDPGAGAVPRAIWISEGEAIVLGNLVAGGTPGPTLFTQYQGTRGALALQGGLLHWTTSTGLVLSLPAGGGVPPTIVAEDQQDPIAITATSGAVLWIDRGAGAVRASAGGVVSTVASFAGAAVGLAADATHAYWTIPGPPGESRGAIWRARWQGGAASAPEEIVGGLSFPYAIAVDGDDLVWTSWGDGTVRRASREGESPRIVAADQAQPIAVALDATSIYWASAGTEAQSRGDGAIMRAAR